MAACILAAAAGRAAAQKPAAAGSPDPALQAIEFRVLLADGRPFGDLRPEDVELKVDGRARVVKSLAFVQPGSGAAAAGADVPPPFDTNVGPANLRDTIVVVDDESIEPGTEETIRAAVRSFMSRLAPQDRVGILAVPRGGVTLSPTADRRAIESGLAALTGRASVSGLAGRGVTASDSDAACRTRQTLDSLMGVFRAASSATPATIVFFSGGLTPPMFDDVTRMSTPVGLCDIRAKDYEEVELAMLASPVSLHVIQVPAPPSSGASGLSNQTAGLEHVAGTTGNRMIRLVGTSDAAMSRLAAATSAFYRATFPIEGSERNGLSHPVSLRVKRPDVEVLARSSVIIPKPRSAGSSGKAATPRDMLRVADAFRDLPLRVAAYVSRENANDKARIVVLVEPVDPAVSLKGAAVGLYDGKGKLVVQATADETGLARTPPMIATVAKPGTYRMRVAATDVVGRAGAVDITLDVKLAGDGPLTLSSLVLGIAEEGRFAGRLQFYDEPTAVAYVEIYGVAKGALSADLELANAENGPAAMRGAMQIKGEASDDRRVALGGIPIRSLPPGDIIVRVVVSLDGAPIGSVSRTLRKATK